MSSSASGASKISPIVSFLCTLLAPAATAEGAGRGCRAGIAPCCRGQRRAEGSLAIRAPVDEIAEEDERGVLWELFEQTVQAFQTACRSPMAKYGFVTIRISNSC